MTSFHCYCSPCITKRTKPLSLRTMPLVLCLRPRGGMNDTSIVMLNTDAHNPAMKQHKKMTKQQFVGNNRGIDGGRDVPTEVLEGIYDDIVRNQIVTVTEREDENELLFSNPTAVGRMEKRGADEMSQRFLSWRKRYFIISSSILYYFRDKTDSDPLGFIMLTDLDVKVLDQSPSSTPTLFRAQSQASLRAAESHSSEEAQGLGTVPSQTSPSPPPPPPPPPPSSSPSTTSLKRGSYQCLPILSSPLTSTSRRHDRGNSDSRSNSSWRRSSLTLSTRRSSFAKATQLTTIMITAQAGQFIKSVRADPKGRLIKGQHKSLHLRVPSPEEAGMWALAMREEMASSSKN